MKKSDFKILIGCEYSGSLRDKFIKLGYNCISCDLEPGEGINVNMHYVEDVFQVIEKFKPNMMIAHPPCTYLSNAGIWRCKNNPGRIEKRNKAVIFFDKLYKSDIQHIMLENPVGWLNNNYKKPCQIIHPYYFGSSHFKRTCLWLKSLPMLYYYTEINLFNDVLCYKIPKPLCFSKSGKKKYYVDINKNKKYRSKSFDEISNAIVIQYDEYLTNIYNFK